MLALLAGVLLALTLPPFPLGWLLPLVLAGVLRARMGFGSGFWLGLGFWGVHLAWLPSSFLARFGALGVLPGILLIGFLSLLFGLLFGLLARRPLALVGAWVLLEAALALLPWPFPWGALGYAAVGGGGRLLAALVGVRGLSLLALAAGYALARGRPLPALLWALLWLLPLPPAPAESRALIVQAALDPLAKAAGEPAETRYRRLTEAGLRQHPEAGLVVWPETAVRYVPEEVDRALADRPLVYGTWGPGPKNEVRLRLQGRDVAGYAKHVLVPFGEYFPGRDWLEPLYRWVFRRFGLPELGDLKAGRELRSLGPYAAFVCYEADFPELVRRLGQDAQLLINVSNDAWFGVGYGRRQHLVMSRMRAVEEGLWLLRAANDGISAAIDPYGRVVARSDEGEPALLLAPFALREGGETLYARLGELPVLGAAYVLLVFSLLESGARSSPPPRGRAGPGGSSAAAARRRRIAARARSRAGRRRG